MKKKLIAIALLSSFFFASAAHAVKPVNVKVPVNAKGMTTEQVNIADKVIRDNKAGALEYIYCISPMTGDVIFFSVAKGKSTSSGKRLQAKTVTSQDGKMVSSQFNGAKLKHNGKTYRTSELMQDDGTYGSSTPYVYWFDQRGVYHKHYPQAGCILHTSDAPLSINKAILNLDDTPSREALGR